MPEHTPAPSKGRAVYGYVLWLWALQSFWGYILWACLPFSVLASVGCTYIPQREWALAAPALIVTTMFVVIYIMYPAVNLTLAVPPQLTESVTDSFALVPDWHLNTSVSGESSSVSSKWHLRSSEVQPRSNVSSHLNKISALPSGVEFNDVKFKCQPLNKADVPKISDLRISDVCRVLYGSDTK